MSTSYAYDPSGKRVAVTIKDGKSYLADGSRIPTGYTVQTGGGIYKMTDSGGVKVDTHNTTTPTRTTDSTRTDSTKTDSDRKITSGTASRQATDSGTIQVDRAPQPTGYTKVGNTYVINKDIYANDPEGSYTRTRSDFNAKYDDIIKSLATYNGVDMSVAEEMLKTNLNQNKGIYAGGGVISSDKWKEMLDDYAMLKNAARQSANNPNAVTRDSYGREVYTKDVLSDIGKNVEGQYREYPQYADLGTNKSGKTNEELAQILSGMQNPSPVKTGDTGVDQAIYEYIQAGSSGSRGNTIGSGGNISGGLLDIIAGLNKGILTYDQAKALADQQLGRDYDKALDTTMKNIDRQSLQSGFFGQLPTMDYKQRNADEIMLNKEQALSQLAYQLMNDSEQDALNYFNTVNNYQNSEWEKAFKEREYADGRTDVDWEKMFKEREYGDTRSDVAWDKQVKESTLTGFFRGQPTMAMTELAHAIGMDEKKMAMAEAELNHDIQMSFEKLKNDKVALSQAWARIGQANESNKLDQQKFMAGVKEQAWKMTMDQLEKSGTSTDGLDFLGGNNGGPLISDLEMEEQIELIWGSYINQLLDGTGYEGLYK